MTRKVLLLLVAIFMDDALEQMAFTITILTASYGLLNSLRPYKMPVLNYVELFKIVTMCGSVWLGSISFGRTHRLGLRNQFANDGGGVLILAISLNVAFLILVVCSGIYLVPGAVLFLYSRIWIPLLSRCPGKCARRRKHRRLESHTPPPLSERRTRTTTKGSRGRQSLEGHRKSLHYNDGFHITPQESQRVLLQRERSHSRETVENRLNEVLRPVTTRRNFRKRETILETPALQSGNVTRKSLHYNDRFHLSPQDSQRALR
eukprot:gb/GECG01000387.1/.p1 GENE.gb/GECG01000387.1/~~gb/GECG01000387.1/.p1  ORF type:complete len:262 (+),score=7.30 gb/GECG01000387.1/:1-786(+)